MPTDKRSNKDFVEHRASSLLAKLKDTYIIVSKKEVRSWKGFVLLGFMTGFVAALFFSVSQDLSEEIFAGTSAITNQASVSYQGADLASYGPTASNSVETTIAQAPSPVPSPEDTTPPSAVVDLSIIQQDAITKSVKFAWTAPGDDNKTGTAVSYDFRYAASEITDTASWNTAIQVQDEPKPSPAGTTDSYILSNLQPRTNYWIGIQAVDDAQNVSQLSNIIMVFTIDGQESPQLGVVTAIQIIIDTEGSYKNNFQTNRLKVYQSTTKSLILDLQGSSNEEGQITFAPNNLTAQTYDLVVVVPRSLTKIVRAVDFSTLSSTPINVRDIVVGNLQDVDDTINSLDFAVLSGKWGTGDSDADFNQDGVVNSLDWGVMNKNWDKQGDETYIAL